MSVPHSSPIKKKGAPWKYHRVSPRCYILCFGRAGVEIFFWPEPHFTHFTFFSRAGTSETSQQQQGGASQRKAQHGKMTDSKAIDRKVTLLQRPKDGE